MVLLEINRTAFSLVEMMAVTAIIIILSCLAAAGYSHVQGRSEVTECAGRLRQVGAAFNLYAQDYRQRLPAAVPPKGFGDLCNWGDLWSSSDTSDNLYFDTATASGVVAGNMTYTPRVPRLLSSYLGGDILALHCTGRGSLPYWPEVGPFYFCVTSPWGQVTMPDNKIKMNLGSWLPYADMPYPMAAVNYPLAACQVPVQLQFYAAAWRHGTRKLNSPDGVNNHLYFDGSVVLLRNPGKWKR